VALETQLGPFTIERELGRGGMGVVYAARWEGRPCALKVALEDISARDLKHFLAEADLVARVSHPGVVEILDSGTLPDGRPFVAMPLLAGETLAARLKRGPLAPDLALRLFAQLAAAVTALHDAGIVHRDIKTENVMYHEDEERLVLLDFGIAREVSRPASTTTLRHRVRGTPGCMAPERFFGVRASASSDVYELSVVLYAMVTGQIPWDDATDPGARLRPRHPAQLGVALPAGLGDILFEALTGRPERRPSARELAVRVRATEDAPLAVGPSKDSRVTVALGARGAEAPRVAQGLPDAPSTPRPPLSPPVGPSAPQVRTTAPLARSAAPLLDEAPLHEQPRRPFPSTAWAAGAIVLTALAVGGAFWMRARRGHPPATVSAVGAESVFAATPPTAPDPPSVAAVDGGGGPVTEKAAASATAPAPSVAVAALPVARPAAAPLPSGTGLVALPAVPPPAPSPVPSATPVASPPAIAAPSAVPAPSRGACQQVADLYCSPIMLARASGQVDCMVAKGSARRDETIVENYCRSILPDVQRLAREQATAPKPAPGTAPTCRRVRDAYCDAMKLDAIWATACQNARADVAVAEGPAATAGDHDAKERMCAFTLPIAMKAVREYFTNRGVTPP
jgi:serine/threonine-protein kinase